MNRTLQEAISTFSEWCSAYRERPVSDRYAMGSADTYAVVVQVLTGVVSDSPAFTLDGLDLEGWRNKYFAEVQKHISTKARFTDLAEAEFERGKRAGRDQQVRAFQAAAKQLWDAEEKMGKAKAFTAAVNGHTLVFDTIDEYEAYLDTNGLDEMGG